MQILAAMWRFGVYKRRVIGAMPRLGADEKLAPLLPQLVAPALMFGTYRCGQMQLHDDEIRCSARHNKQRGCV